MTKRQSATKRRPSRAAGGSPYESVVRYLDRLSTLEGSLDEVRAADARVKAALESRAHAVGRARNLGASWWQVGASLGVSRQAAAKGFGNA